jgi:hypothetical protein
MSLNREDNISTEMDSSYPLSLTRPATDTNAVLNSWDLGYENELRCRRVFFVYEDETTTPDNFNDLEDATYEDRDSPEPEDEDMINFRNRARQSETNPSILQSMLSKIIDLEDILDSDDLNTTACQQWADSISLPSTSQRRIPAPIPDQTVGFHVPKLGRCNAIAHLGASACPTESGSNLAFPLFTVETKKNLKIARLQNLHNAAVMLNNLSKLVRKKKEFFGKAHVFTLSLTPESIELCYYWATKDANGEISFYGQACDSWSTISKYGYTEPRDCTRNALSWVLSQARLWIPRDLEALELTLRPGLHLHPAPPNGDRKRQKPDSEGKPLGKPKKKKSLPAPP